MKYIKNLDRFISESTQDTGYTISEQDFDLLKKTCIISCTKQDLQNFIDTTPNIAGVDDKPIPLAELSKRIPKLDFIFGIYCSYMEAYYNKNYIGDVKKVYFRAIGHHISDNDDRKYKYALTPKDIEDLRKIGKDVYEEDIPNTLKYCAGGWIRIYHNKKRLTVEEAMKIEPRDIILYGLVQAAKGNLYLSEKGVSFYDKDKEESGDYVGGNGDKEPIKFNMKNPELVSSAIDMFGTLEARYLFDYKVNDFPNASELSRYDPSFTVEIDGKKNRLMHESVGWDYSYYKVLYRDWYDDIIETREKMPTIVKKNGKYNIIGYPKETRKHNSFAEPKFDDWFDEINPKPSRIGNEYVLVGKLHGKTVYIFNDGSITSPDETSGNSSLLKEVETWDKNRILKDWIEAGKPVVRQTGFAYKGGGWSFIDKKEAKELLSVSTRSEGFNTYEWDVKRGKVCLVFNVYSENDLY